MMLLHLDESALNFYSGDTDLPSNGWLGVPRHSIEDCGRVFMSRLPNVATAITLVSDKAYFVYIGRTTKPVRIKYIEFFVTTQGAGTDTVAELGLFSTPQA